MRILRWITGLASALLIASFAAINRESITLTWLPFTQTQEIPLNIAAMAILAFGFLLGIIIYWLNSAPFRAQRRAQQKQILQLEKQLQAVNENQKNSDGFAKSALSSLQRLKKRIK